MFSDRDGAPRARAAAAWNAAVIANGRHDSIGARRSTPTVPLPCTPRSTTRATWPLLGVVSAALRRQPEPDGHAALRDIRASHG